MQSSVGSRLKASHYIQHLHNMAPSFENLPDDENYEEEDIDFSGECDAIRTLQGELPG